VPKQDRNVEIYPFAKEALVLVCSMENALANETKVNIHKLQGREFIAFETDVPTRKLIDNILAQYNVTMRTVMEFDNIETIKRAVEIDAGVSILPQTTIRAELANGTLAAMPFANDNFYRPTGIVVRKNKTLSVAARYLIELLQKNI
jgi:DNA-binding transcriptional LysR family regulator